MFLSTPPSRVATLHDLAANHRVDVSIHATLAGGDVLRGNGVVRRVLVSIHATLAGGDFTIIARLTVTCMFLSTPPSRVATRRLQTQGGRNGEFLSTPPSRVATCGFVLCRRVVGVFLSTPPSRVATESKNTSLY